jgi:hypothetical protein
MDDVVGKQKHLKKGYTGNPVHRWYLAEGIIVQQFANIFLDDGPFRIEAPNSPQR